MGLEIAKIVIVIVLVAAVAVAILRMPDDDGPWD